MTFRRNISKPSGSTGRLWRILRCLVMITGSFALLMTILAFTSLPFYAWYALSMNKAGINRPPDLIIVMGGGGMPSESGLMRTWYASKLANHYSGARVIIALPGNIKDSLSSVNQMKEEMILRGILPERIMIEDSGTNTRSQALRIFQSFSHDAATNLHLPAVAIVTSPEHLYRAVRVFRKIGFMRVDGLPAFESAIESDISFNGKKIGRRKWVPEVGENLSVRYNFWTQLKYETLLFREFMAIGYYRINGWI